MLINFNDIVLKYGKPCGIIHIGAHLTEEKNDYLKYNLDNTIWIEANPYLFETIKVNGLEKERFFNYAMTDTDDKLIQLNITNNGQSSSILELEKHKIHHPDIYVSNTVNVSSKRMDTLINENNLDIDKYDFLNIDVQGVELLVLKGFGDYLKKIRYIYTEVNTDYLYKNCALISEIDSYLKDFNFTRVETNMTKFKWGDALYVNKY